MLVRPISDQGDEIGKLEIVGGRRWDLGKRLVGLMATEVPEVPGLHRLYLVMDDDSIMQ
jgi:hypothetical protein